MVYLLVGYGAVFVCTGFALGVQARAAAPTEPIPRTGLWAVTLFALVHGASEWLALGVHLEEREHGAAPPGLGLARIALLAVSFAALGAFGLLLAARRDRPRPWALSLGTSAGALLAAALAAWLTVGAGRAPVDPGALAAAEGAIRYGLGVPASAAACAGLLLVRRRIRDEHWVAARYVAAAAAAFAAYGFFAGVVVPPSTLGPAAALNTASFWDATHVPALVLRAAAMATAGLSLSEVFVRTTTDHLRREVEHLRDGFISLVAHDLRTPLGTVANGVALLERLPPGEHGTEREARILRVLDASVRAMTKIVSDLLDASRVEARKLSISLEPIDLVPLLLRIIEWAPAEAMRDHAVRLVPPGPLPPVLADPVRVEQVLSNLLSNAGKYSPAGTEILLDARTGPGEVTLSVTNAGPGISAADLPRVFSRHFRTGAARRGRAPGLGLGLYIARGLVESQGGRMWAESEPGVRTTFSFTLPRAPARQPARELQAVRDAGGARLPL